MKKGFTVLVLGAFLFSSSCFSMAMPDPKKVVDTSELNNMVRIDASFIHAITSMTEEQLLAKILETRREIRRIQELIDEANDDIRSEERFYEIANHSFKATQSAAVISLVLQLILTGNVQDGKYFPGRLKDFSKNKLFNQLTVAPIALSVLAYLIRHRSESKISLKEDEKREIEVRLWELQDRLRIIEHVARMGVISPEARQ